jgi:hypothetical protein
MRQANLFYFGILAKELTSNIDISKVRYDVNARDQLDQSMAIVIVSSSRASSRHDTSKKGDYTEEPSNIGEVIVKSGNITSCFRYRRAGDRVVLTHDVPDRGTSFEKTGYI